MVRWTMAQAKRDFGIGYLTGFQFERLALASDVWLVRLAGGTARGALVDARSRSPRQFKSLDAAVAAVEQIGFRVDGLKA
ncbi:hypothetical protein WJ28_11705 [Burkholderia thailandensis]|nr:hypothetical protein WJ27_03780 [Burkholderia thailandensis]KVG16781.1 hypothetical protein WJ28_11705 [Burkholderia thailandensis]